jgi:hypothetical protein
MSCWTSWTEALQKHNLPDGACEIHFIDKERGGMWGYWSIDGSSHFFDAVHFQKDENGDWQGDDQDLAFIIRPCVPTSPPSDNGELKFVDSLQQHLSYVQLPR